MSLDDIAVAWLEDMSRQAVLRAQQHSPNYTMAHDVWPNVRQSINIEKITAYDMSMGHLKPRDQDKIRSIARSLVDQMSAIPNLNLGIRRG
jgi:hypothetical protein